MASSSGRDIGSHLDNLLNIGDVSQTELQYVSDLLTNMQQMEERINGNTQSDYPRDETLGKITTMLGKSAEPLQAAYNLHNVKTRLDDTADILTKLNAAKELYKDKNTEEASSWACEFIGGLKTKFHKVFNSTTEADEAMRNAQDISKGNPDGGLGMAIQSVEDSRENFLQQRIIFKGVICFFHMAYSLYDFYDTYYVLKQVRTKVNVCTNELERLEGDIHGLVDQTNQTLIEYQQGVRLSADIYTLCSRYENIRHRLEVCVQRLADQEVIVSKKSSAHKRSAFSSFLSTTLGGMEAAMIGPVVANPVMGAINIAIPVLYGLSAVGHGICAKNCDDLVLNIREQIDKGKVMQEQLKLHIEKFYSGLRQLQQARAARRQLQN